MFHILICLIHKIILAELEYKMFKTTSKSNQVSDTNSFTNSHAKIRKLEKMNSEHINGLLSKSYIVKFCKENIIQQNEINNKG